MKQLDAMRFARLDFAPRARFPIWMTAGLLLCALALGSGVWRVLEFSQASDDATKRDRAARQAASDHRAAPPAPLPPERVAAVNEAIVALNTPWPALLGAIESVRPDAVSISLLEPRTQERTVRLSAQAETMPALVNFMEELAATAPFDRATPLRQEELPPAQPGSGGTAGLPASRRLQLSFELHWKDAP